MDASQRSALSKKANNLELSLFLGTKSNSKMVTGCVAKDYLKHLKHIWIYMRISSTSLYFNIYLDYAWQPS